MSITDWRQDIHFQLRLKMPTLPGCWWQIMLASMAATISVLIWPVSRPAPILPWRLLWHAARLDPSHSPLHCLSATCNHAQLCFIVNSYRPAGLSDIVAPVCPDWRLAWRRTQPVSYLGKFVHHPGTEHALADPLCVVEAMTKAPNLPPIFIAAGLDDPVAADSRRLEDALKRLQSTHTAHYYPGETHAFHVMVWREQAIRCWRDSFEFLRRYLPVEV